MNVKEVKIVKSSHGLRRRKKRLNIRGCVLGSSLSIFPYKNYEFLRGKKNDRKSSK